MAKMTAKDYGKILLLGSGVVVLTPMLAGFVSGVEFLGIELWEGFSIGTALSAGVVAFVVDWAIRKYLP